MIMKISKIIFPVFFIAVSLSAQSERSYINNGVDEYEAKKFNDAEVNFKKGLEKNEKSFEGHFNLGSALYKQGRYDEALQSYNNALANAEDEYVKSKILYNMGNTLLKAQKIDESIKAYKNSLKLDPKDLEAKYNLSYALKMKQKQENQQNQNQQNKDNKDNQDKQDQNQQQQDQQNQDKQDQKNEQQQPQQQQKKNEVSKEEAKRMLEALKNKESDLQKELRKKKGKPVNKEKDW